MDNNKIWSEFKKNYKNVWAAHVAARFKDFTPEEIAKIDGSKEILEALLQERYRMNSTVAGQDVQSFGTEIIAPSLGVEEAIEEQKLAEKLETHTKHEESKKEKEATHKKSEHKHSSHAHSR